MIIDKGQMNIDKHKKLENYQVKNNIGCTNCIYAFGGTLSKNHKKIIYNCQLRDRTKYYTRRCWKFIHKKSILNKIRMYIIEVKLFIKKEWKWILPYIISVLSLIIALVK